MTQPSFLNRQYLDLTLFLALKYTLRKIDAKIRQFPFIYPFKMLEIEKSYKYEALI